MFTPDVGRYRRFCLWREKFFGGLGKNARPPTRRTLDGWEYWWWSEFRVVPWWWPPRWIGYRYARRQWTDGFSCEPGEIYYYTTAQATRIMLEETFAPKDDPHVGLS